MTQSTAGSAESLGLEDFLGHSNRSGGGASFLDNWKKRGEDGNPGKPEVRVLLHTRAPIMSVWQFPWPKIVTRVPKGGKTEVREVWSGTFNSWEKQEILQRQYLRDDDGARAYPPELCPMAIMVEEIERLMREGKLDWREVLFKFSGDDPAKTKLLHAGAMTNKVKKIWETISDKEKRSALKAGFPSPMHSWKESMMAKCQYVFTVVEFDKPEDGIQIAKETTLVGDKTKKVIRDRMTSEGDDKGNPLVNPYVLQFSHNKNSKQFQDRYDVVAIGRLKVTDEMLELIREKDPPDLTRYTAPGDIVALRASVEDHYCGPADLLDFDYIFGKAEALAGIEEADDEDVPEEEPAGSDSTDTEEADDTEEAVTEEADEEEAPANRIIAKRKGKGEDQRCFNSDGVEVFGCEECDAIMLDSEDVCYKCGADYSDADGDDGDDETPIAEMTLEQCEEALLSVSDATEEEELKARVAELKPPPARRRRTGKASKTGAKKGGKASERAAKKGADVDF